MPLVRSSELHVIPEVSSRSGEISLNNGRTFLLSKHVSRSAIQRMIGDNDPKICLVSCCKNVQHGRPVMRKGKGTK